MRLMLVGQQWLGAEVLRAVCERGHQVRRVAAPAGDRLGQAAIDADIPVADPGARLEAAWVPEGVDLIVCAHAHCYVTAGARARARLGAIGYHPSLLPRHRGRDAVRWAIHMRDAVTGGTVYQMDDRADGGPVLAQDWCFVWPDDTPATLWRRDLGPMGIRLLVRVIDDLAAGTARATAQSEPLATWEPSFTRPQLRSKPGSER